LGLGDGGVGVMNHTALRDLVSPWHICRRKALTTVADPEEVPIVPVWGYCRGYSRWKVLEVNV
jgi:hypothetical protein